MRRAFLHLIRVATIIMAIVAITLSLFPLTSLYFSLFEGAPPGQDLSPEAFVLPLPLSIAILGGVAGLLWVAYVADRFAVARLRASA